MIGVALVDPSVPTTKGFHLREAGSRLMSPDAWINLVSGRAVRARMEEGGQKEADASLPPGFFGLLTAGREKYLSLLSGGIKRYLNSADQVQEALPNVFANDLIQVGYRPHMDQILARSEDQEWLVDTLYRCIAGQVPMSG